MSTPTRSMIHIDRALTNVSVAYMQDANNFIADKVFPVIPVKNQGDAYYIYDKGDMLRTDAKRRAPGTESAGRGHKLSNSSYFAEVYAVHSDIADQDKENADEPLNLEIDATEILTNDLLMRREIDWFAKYFKPSVWSNADITPSTLWSATGSTPIEDISTQVQVIRSNTGVSPLDMDLTLSPDVWEILKNHPEIVDRIKHTQVGIVTQGLIASLIGIRNVYVAYGITNTAPEGATAVIANIASAKDCLLTYSPRVASLKKPSAGYTFVWSRYAAAGFKSAVVKKFRMDTIESDRIEAQLGYDMKTVALDAGVFFNNVIA